MHKRYQVFISSTFRDLIDERQETLKAVLEIDHMPAGMELFPASDDTAWNLIKDVIDASDYYILIIGGRYGSLDEEGISYTEKEYEYAIEMKKPVIPLLHKNPDNLPRDKTETENDAWESLQNFREKVESKHTCVYWENADELKAKVIVGLTTATKRSPGVGWVRTDQVPSRATIEDLYNAQKRIAELESELKSTIAGPPPGTEKLMQDDDEFSIDIRFTARDSVSGARTSYTATIGPTWNEIFSHVSPVLMNESSEAQLLDSFKSFVTSYGRTVFKDDEDLKGKALVSFSSELSDFHTCIVQLRALGLIKESEKKRSVRDTDTYWQLTPHGDQMMVQLRALLKEPIEKKPSGTRSDQEE